MSGGAIENMGFSPNDRKYLFYLVCIPVRLSIVALVYKYEDSRLMIPVAIAMSILAIKSNLNKSEVWWSRRTHLINAIAILFYSLAGVPSGIKYILLLDIIQGVSSSIIEKPW